MEFVTVATAPARVVRALLGSLWCGALDLVAAKLRRLREGVGRLEAGAAAAPASSPSAAALRIEAELPAAYGDDRLVLLARDPSCLFAYWDLSAERQRSVQALAGGEAARKVLRVYDVTFISFSGTKAWRHQDLLVANDVGSAYVDVETPGASYVAEIGYLRPDGAFFALARSNVVWTARAGEPGHERVRWMTVRWNRQPERIDAAPPTTMTAAASRRPSRKARSSSRP